MVRVLLWSNISKMWILLTFFFFYHKLHYHILTQNTNLFIVFHNYLRSYFLVLFYPATMYWLGVGTVCTPPLLLCCIFSSDKYINQSMKSVDRRKTEAVQAESSRAAPDQLWSVNKPCTPFIPSSVFSCLLEIPRSATGHSSANIKTRLCVRASGDGRGQVTDR